MAKTSAAVQSPDVRRITEHDPDVARLRVFWTRRLMASLRRLQRDIAQGGELAIGPAQNAFIHRHIDLLRQAYLAGHHEGQRDYWDEVSATPERWAKRNAVTPSEALIQRRLMFYGAASVVKLSREVAAVWRSHYTMTRSRTPSRAAAPQLDEPQAGETQLGDSSSQRLADPPPDLAWSKFTAWASPRIGLQADVTWSGFQDGYVASAATDAAGLSLKLWWDLEPAAKHCDDCPAIAAGSPYTADELQTTPGDGTTACGASCKCALRYAWWNDTVGDEVLGPAVEAMATPSKVGPGGMVAGAPDMSVRQMPTSGTPLSDLTAGQRAALDLFRVAVEQWEPIRGTLPSLTAFSDLNEAAWAQVDEAHLTTEQRAVLEQYLEALNAWDEETPFE